MEDDSVCHLKVTIWKERNNRDFRGSSSTAADLISKVALKD